MPRSARPRRGRWRWVATLPELLPEDIAADMMAAGVAPLNGLAEAVAAAAAAAWLGRPRETPPALVPPGADAPTVTLTEAEAKARLADVGIAIPESRCADTAETAAAAAEALGYPVALKALGVAHKTEAGALALNLRSAAAVADAARMLPPGPLLVERMVTGAVAEVLLGVVRDPAHGFVLTLAAGGVLAELLDDRAHLLVPAPRADVAAALAGLKVARLLAGWRGGPTADLAAILDAAMALQRLVVDSGGRIVEVEINPLIATPAGAVAVDALLREVR